MKKMIKNTKLLLYICLAMFLLNSCTEEKEYLENGNRDIKTSKKSFKELMLLNDFSKAYKKVAFEKQRNLASRTALEEQYNFTIAEDKEVNVVEIDGKTFYNLLIRRDASTTAFFENLLIKTEIANNQEEASAYIVKYFTPDDTQYTYGNDKEITQLYGKITIVKRIVCVTLCHATNTAHPLPHSPYSDACFNHLQTQCWEYYGTSGEEDYGGGGGNSNTGTTTSGGGGGDGSSSGAGGSPPPQNGASPPPGEELELLPVEEEEPFLFKKPCERLGDMANPNLQNIKPWVDIIKQKEISHTINEWSVCFKKTGPTNSLAEPTDFTYTNELGEGTPGDSPFYVGEYYVGSVHCHTFSSVGLFSFGDLLLLSRAYEGVFNNLRNDVTMLLVSIEPPSTVPNVYAIKVNNIILLKDKLNEFLANSKYAAPSEKEKIDLIHSDLGDVWRGVSYEKSFLQTFGSFGISLYKATNDDLTSWGKLKLDPSAPNGVDNIPCVLQ